MLAGGLTGFFLAHAERTPCYPAKEGKDAMGRLAGQMGPLAGQLQKGRDGLCPVSRHIWVEVVMEGRQNPKHYRTGQRAATASQPGGTHDHGPLPDNQPGNSVDGDGTQTNGSPAAE